VPQWIEAGQGKGDLY